MKPISDCELLDRWRDRSDRGAMDELVRRNVHFVYGAARRQVRDAAWAEDVTQAVFMLLMHKSPRVRSDAALAVWLHRAARYAAANARRMLTRQANRDRRAAKPEALKNPSNAADAEEYRELLPVLDEAIDRLPERDRSGVVMCFFQRCTYGQIGAVLGITEEAARKRVSRAVDRMREHFAERGVLTSSAALCATLTSESAVAAPATLAGATANLATLSQLAAGASGATSSTTTIMNGVIHTMLMTKVKLAAAACAAIVFGGAVTGAAIHRIGATPSPASVAVSTVVALGAEPFKAQVSDKLEAAFLGVNAWDAGGKNWFAIDGSKVDDPRGPFINQNFRAPPGTTHQLVLHVTGPAAGGYAVQVDGKRCPLYDLTPSDDEAYLLVPFTAPKDATSVDVELRLADGEWQTLCTSEHEPGRPPESHTTERGGIAFTHVSETPEGHAMVYVAHEINPELGQFDVYATDAQGNDRRCVNTSGRPVGNFYAMNYVYDVPPDQITGLVAKVRPFNKTVIARHVALDPAHPTKPQIVVEDRAEKK